jgi:LacI family transcriptional regulator
VKESGGRRVTLKDVAAAAGVSVSTASRALNPHSRHSIAPPVAARIRELSKQLGYIQNVAAYSLKTNRSKAIGIIVPDIADPMFPPVIRGIEQGLERHNYITMLSNTDDDPHREARAIEVMSARGVDGFILASVRRREATLPRLLNGKAVVSVIRQVENAEIASVVHDQEEGVRRILTHLLSLGHRQIAHIAGPQNLSTGFGCYDAFVRYAQASGLRDAKKKTVFAARFTELDGERCAEELMAGGQPFTAVVCANDRLAIGAIAAFQRRGLACPDDVSVVGMNDMPLADRLRPPLTTVHQQHYRAGVECAELLVDILEGPEREHPRHIVLPVELVIRGSTSVPRNLSAAKSTQRRSSRSARASPRNS